MLTVKYVGSDGVEEIFSADRVRLVRDHKQETWRDAGVYIDYDEDDHGVIPTSAKKHIPYARTGGPGINPPTVYVMNRFGATVATYRL